MTVCTKNRINYFCGLEENKCVNSDLSEVGELVNYWWKEVPRHFENVLLDEFVIMPNYLHGILLLKKNEKIRDVVQWFKTIVTISYLMEMGMKNWPKINNKLWQDEHYEQIIRNEKEYLMANEYITNNPKIIF
ncbi:MAG: transposase [Candidatus Shapirobacteria bacterium]|nr:transposase [Candidatus Shapirobacteria bacterium]